MRFDAERAMADANALGEPRYAGTEGETRAAEWVGTEFEEAGLEVERCEVPAPRHVDLVEKVVGTLGVVLPATMWLLVSGKAAMACILVGGAWLLLILLGAFRWLAWLLPRGRTVNVTAGQRNASERPVRVLIVTHLDTPPRRWSDMMRAAVLLAAFFGFACLGQFLEVKPWRSHNVLLVTLAWALFGLVFCQLLLSRDPLLERLPQRTAVTLAAVCAVGILQFAAYRYPFVRPLIAGVWLGIVSTLMILWMCEPWRRVGGPGEADNRSGLAVMLELARRWPNSARELVDARFGVGRPGEADSRSRLAALLERAGSRPGSALDQIDVRFAALGGRAMSMAGAGALARDIQARWPAKPTLVVNLEAPGVGPLLVLSGEPQAVGILAGAAQSLWMPYQVVRPMSRYPRGHHPFARAGLTAVSVFSQQRSEPPFVGQLWWLPRDAVVEPATLAETAQLVTEFALRWARQQTQEGGDSAARSSQKPG
jgi:hypothetical protein